MLKGKANELIKEINECIDLVIKNGVGVASFERMDATELYGMQKIMRLSRTISEYMVEESAAIDEINSKLDKLLKKEEA